MYVSKESHMEATLRVVRYIKSLPGQGLLMPTQNLDTLTAYCDLNLGTFLRQGGQSMDI